VNLAPLRWLLCVLLLVVVSSCASPGPISVPDDDVVAGGNYENKYFSFTLPIQDSWHITHGEALERLLDTMAIGGETGSIDYLLLVVSEVPLETATEFNPSLAIGASNLSQYGAISSGQEYLTQLADGLAKPPYSDVGEVYEYQLDAKPFYRLDLIMDTEIGPIQQSYISVASKEYILNFVLTGKVREDIDALEAILAQGDFGGLSEEVKRSGRVPVSSAQGVLALFLVCAGAGLVVLDGWLKRRKAARQEGDQEG